MLSITPPRCADDAADIILRRCFTLYASATPLFFAMLLIIIITLFFFFAYGAAAITLPPLPCRRDTLLILLIYDAIDTPRYADMPYIRCCHDMPLLLPCCRHTYATLPLRASFFVTLLLRHAADAIIFIISFYTCFDAVYALMLMPLSC